MYKFERSFLNTSNHHDQIILVWHQRLHHKSNIFHLNETQEKILNKSSSIVSFYPSHPTDELFLHKTFHYDWNIHNNFWMTYRLSMLNYELVDLIDNHVHLLFRWSMNIVKQWELRRSNAYWYWIVVNYLLNGWKYEKKTSLFICWSTQMHRSDDLTSRTSDQHQHVDLYWEKYVTLFWTEISSTWLLSR